MRKSFVNRRERVHKKSLKYTRDLCLCFKILHMHSWSRFCTKDKNANLRDEDLGRPKITLNSWKFIAEKCWQNDKFHHHQQQHGELVCCRHFSSYLYGHLQIASWNRLTVIYHTSQHSSVVVAYLSASRKLD